MNDIEPTKHGPDDTLAEYVHKIRIMARCVTGSTPRYYYAIDALAEQIEHIEDNQRRATAALREAFGPELWSLGHPAYIVTHLREELAKVTNLWKRAEARLEERWVIEDADSPPSRPDYYTGSFLWWTTNPYDALHFVDKRSAELAAKNLFANSNSKPRVACHSFLPIMENG